MRRTHFCINNFGASLKAHLDARNHPHVHVANKLQHVRRDCVARQANLLSRHPTQFRSPEAKFYSNRKPHNYSPMPTYKGGPNLWKRPPVASLPSKLGTHSPKKRKKRGGALTCPPSSCSLVLSKTTGSTTTSGPLSAAPSETKTPPGAGRSTSIFPGSVGNRGS